MCLRRLSLHHLIDCPFRHQRSLGIKLNLRLWTPILQGLKRLSKHIWNYSVSSTILQVFRRLKLILTWRRYVSKAFLREMLEIWFFHTLWCVHRILIVRPIQPVIESFFLVLRFIQHVGYISFFLLSKLYFIQFLSCMGGFFRKVNIVSTSIYDSRFAFVKIL